MAVITNLTVNPIFLTELDLTVNAQSSITVVPSAAEITTIVSVKAYINAGILSVADAAVPATIVPNPAAVALADEALLIREALAANTQSIDFNAQRLINLASGVSDTDVALVGQVPVVVLNPLGSGQDDWPNYGSVSAHCAAIGVALFFAAGTFLAAESGFYIPSNSVYEGTPSTKIRSTDLNVAPANSPFVATTGVTEVSPQHHGTLDVNAVTTGIGSVQAYGTAPPTITITGKPDQTVACVLVQALTSGALTAWTGQYSIDGVTWTNFTSAATVAVGGTGLTLNIAAGSASTNNKWAAQGPRSFSITFGDSLPPTVGNAISVEHGTSQAVYDIVATFANTVVVDRRIVWAFVATNTVRELATYPHDITIRGRGMKFSGTGGQYIEIAGGNRVTIEDVNIIPDDGVITESPIGFDVSTRNAELNRFTIDMPGGNADGDGVYFQSTERTVVRSGLVKNVAHSYAIYDSYQSGIEDCWSYGTTRGGIRITKNNGTTLGSIEPFVRRGGTLNTVGTAILITDALSADIDSHSINGCDNAIDVGNGAVGTRIRDLPRVTNVGGTAVHIHGNASDTRVSSVTFSACAAAFLVDESATGTRLKDVTISGCTGQHIVVQCDLDLQNYLGDIGASDGAAGLLKNAGSGKIVTVTGARVTSEAAGAVVFQFSGAGGGINRVTNAVVTMTTGVNQTGFYCTTETTYLSYCKATGPASAFGVYVRSGVTVYLGPGCDFSGCGTPIYVESGGILIVTTADLIGTITAVAGSTIYLQQLPGVATQNATGALTQTQMQMTEVESSGNASGTVTITASNAIPGLQWTFRNNNTGTSTTTFMGITVAAGKTAIIRINSVGVGERVTADT